MARTPIVFLHTDAPAFLPPPADARTRVRHYRTPHFIFTLARDEAALVRVDTDAAAVRRRSGGWRRRAPAADPETLVVTDHRVLRFEPTGWQRRWNESPLAESPYEVTEIPLEAVAQARAVPVHGFATSGALELLTWCGERELVLFVPDAPAVAARINALVGAQD